MPDTSQESSALHGLASIAEPGHPWHDSLRFGAELAEQLARELPDASSPDATERLLDAQLEQFAEDVARGIAARPQERHAIILSRKGRHHTLMQAIWRHVDRLRNEEGA
jgi:hypothetical protein